MILLCGWTLRCMPLADHIIKKRCLKLGPGFLYISIMSRTTFYYDAAFPLIYGMVCSGFISGGLLNNVKLRQIVSTQIRPYRSQTILLCVYKIPCVRSDSKSLFNLEFRFLWVRSSSHQEKLYKPPMLG